MDYDKVREKLNLVLANKHVYRVLTGETETIRTAAGEEITNPTDENTFHLANVMSNNNGNNGMA